MSADDISSVFTTRSNVILIANEWRTANPNVRALEDRAIILHFCPSNAKIHRRVGEWFDDQEVYAFLGRVVDLATSLSMRHYKGTQTAPGRAGRLAQQPASDVLSDPQLACVLAAQYEPALPAEAQRVAHFVKMSGCSRATYFRIKAQLGRNGGRGE